MTRSLVSFGLLVAAAALEMSAPARAALGDPEPMLRCAATFKIEDQATLLEVALHDINPSPRSLAASKLADLATRVAIAQNDPDGYMRRAALDGIRDQELRARIARTDPDAYVRQDALLGLEPAPGRALLEPLRDANVEVRLWLAASRYLPRHSSGVDRAGREVRLAAALLVVRMTTQDDDLATDATEWVRDLLSLRYFGDPIRGIGGWDEPIPFHGWDPIPGSPLGYRIEGLCDRGDPWACATAGGIKVLGLHEIESLFVPDPARAKVLLARNCEGGVPWACSLRKHVDAQRPSGAAAVASSMLGGQSAEPTAVDIELANRCDKGDSMACLHAAHSHALRDRAKELLGKTCDGDVATGCYELGRALADREDDAGRARAAGAPGPGLRWRRAECVPGPRRSQRSRIGHSS